MDYEEKQLVDTRCADDLIEVSRRVFGTHAKVYPYPVGVLKNPERHSDLLGKYTRMQLHDAAEFLVRLGVYDKPLGMGALK